MVLIIIALRFLKLDRTISQEHNPFWIRYFMRLSLSFFAVSVWILQPPTTTFVNETKKPTFTLIRSHSQVFFLFILSWIRFSFSFRRKNSTNSLLAYSIRLQFRSCARMKGGKFCLFIKILSKLFRNKSKKKSRGKTEKNIKMCCAQVYAKLVENWKTDWDNQQFCWSHFTQRTYTSSILHWCILFRKTKSNLEKRNQKKTKKNLFVNHRIKCKLFGMKETWKIDWSIA